MRVAIVHHWFVTRGGGERVAACIASLFPGAEIFTLVSEPEGIPGSLRERPLHHSFLQRLPLARHAHRHMLPLYPAAVRSLDLRGFDLVLSSDSGPIKGVRLDEGAVHICYCHSPMRYLYDGYASYRAQMGPLTRAAFTLTAGPVRRWDTAAAQHVTWFLANSHYVARRIARWYGRESTVIYPPIDLKRARRAEPGSHYLAAGRLVGYKHTRLLIEACVALGRQLHIVGNGPEEARLRALHAPGVHFLGALPTEALWDEYSRCRALLFAADEDFGMVPVEAESCGRPVIALGVGGSLETVRALGAQPTGVYFAEQTAASLTDAIGRFETADARGTFIPDAIQTWAAQFSTQRFLDDFRAFVLSKAPAAESCMAPAS